MLDALCCYHNAWNATPAVCLCVCLCRCLIATTCVSFVAVTTASYRTYLLTYLPLGVVLNCLTRLLLQLVGLYIQLYSPHNMVAQANKEAKIQQMK